MTDEQKKLSATLRKWAKYARTAGTPEAVEVTAADLAEAVEFTGGEFTRKDYRPYQSFRARLINDPELLAEFDARRDKTRAAFAPVVYGNADERDLERLADALDTEADYVEGLDLQDGRSGQGGTLARIEKAQGEMADALIKQGVTLDRIDANTRPRKTARGDFEVSQRRAADILARVNCPVAARTVQNWEAGKGTPEGYNRELRKSLVAFTQWARDYARKEQGKINLKNAVGYRDGHGYK